MEFIHPDDRSATASEASRLENSEVTFAFENRYLCKDGSYKWISWNAVRHREESDLCSRARYYRAQAGRREAAETEERHRKLFDNNPHPTWVYDRETLQFLAVNRATVEKYGYSREEFLAMTIKDIRSPEYVPLLLESVGAVRDGD